MMPGLTSLTIVENDASTALMHVVHFHAINLTREEESTDFTRVEASHEYSLSHTNGMAHSTFLVMCLLGYRMTETIVKQLKEAMPKSIENINRLVAINPTVAYKCDFDGQRYPIGLMGVIIHPDETAVPCSLYYIFEHLNLYRNNETSKYKGKEISCVVISGLTSDMISGSSAEIYETILESRLNRYIPRDLVENYQHFKDGLLALIFSYQRQDDEKTKAFIQSIKLILTMHVMPEYLDSHGCLKSDGQSEGLSFVKFKAILTKAGLFGGFSDQTWGFLYQDWDPESSIEVRQITAFKTLIRLLVAKYIDSEGVNTFFSCLMEDTSESTEALEGVNTLLKITDSAMIKDLFDITVPSDQDVPEGDDITLTAFWHLAKSDEHNGQLMRLFKIAATQLLDPAVTIIEQAMTLVSLQTPKYENRSVFWFLAYSDDMSELLVNWLLQNPIYLCKSNVMDALVSLPQSAAGDDQNISIIWLFAVNKSAHPVIRLFLQNQEWFDNKKIIRALTVSPVGRDLNRSVLWLIISHSDNYALIEQFITLLFNSIGMNMIQDALTAMPIGDVENMSALWYLSFIDNISIILRLFLQNQDWINDKKTIRALTASPAAGEYIHRSALWWIITRSDDFSLLKQFMILLFSSIQKDMIQVAVTALPIGDVENVSILWHLSFIDDINDILVRWIEEDERYNNDKVIKALTSVSDSVSPSCKNITVIWLLTRPHSTRRECINLLLLNEFPLLLHPAVIKILTLPVKEKNGRTNTVLDNVNEGRFFECRVSEGRIMVGRSKVASIESPTVKEAYEAGFLAGAFAKRFQQNSPRI